MNHGFVRVGAATLHTKVADCSHNTDQIINILNEAVVHDVAVLVTPELGITGYTCGDLFHQVHLTDQVLLQLQRIKEATIGQDIVVIVGAPLKVRNGLYNCAVVIAKGALLGVSVKTYIPNYSEFYEKRWFVSGQNLLDTTITLLGEDVPIGTNLLYQHKSFGHFTLGIEICEDLWVPIPPSSSMALGGATLIFNPSASNDLVGKSHYRTALIKNQSARTMTGYVYASAGYGESSTDLVFGGHCLITENGSTLATNTRYQIGNQLITADVDLERLNADRQKFMTYNDGTTHLNKPYRTLLFDIRMKPMTFDRVVDPHPFVPEDKHLRDERCMEIFSIQSLGLAKRLEHTQIKKVVIGISGGLDSSLALLVATKTYDLLSLPREDIVCITMPGYGTTDRTYQNACTLVQQLGCTLVEINITAACEQHFKDIDHDPDLHNVTYENTQARERTQILMDYANKIGALVIGTGDLSELALGWATYNGDHMSMYGVNTSIPKTLVRYLVQWVADNEVTTFAHQVLMDIFNTPVSPELLPPDPDGNIHQKTEELIGPYELHDFFLYYCVRFGFSPSKIYALATNAFKGCYEADVIKKWLSIFYKRFFSQQFKRSCLPDGPKVGSINLSPRGDWRMPSDAVAASWLNEIDNL